MRSQKRKEADKRHGAKDQTASTARARLWEQQHPEACAARMRRIRDEHGRNDGIYAQLITEARDPLHIKSENIILSSDWHCPFTDEKLVRRLFAVAKENGTKDLIIAGDLWDCDNYSRFTHLGYSIVFPEEIEEVKKELKRIVRNFEHVFICRGNHEKRWIDLNARRMNMKELFRLVTPGNISEDDFNDKVKITGDDHIYLEHHDETWLVCHPRNFRITPLSVGRDLAAKKLCNIAVAHGHGFTQGHDRSGRFRTIDMGGLFDVDALDYHRETTCHPEVRSGFYLLKNGELKVFEGK